MEAKREIGNRQIADLLFGPLLSVLCTESCVYRRVGADKPLLRCSYLIGYPRGPLFPCSCLWLQRLLEILYTRQHLFRNYNCSDWLRSGRSLIRWHKSTLGRLCRSPYQHNPNLQHLLYLRSVTQVGLMQILQMVQLYSANNISKFGPNLTTEFKCTLPVK